MEIETKTASLETFSVTIRALHVNGKQMTLAVFRQLPVGHEQDGDSEWGQVRYTIKDSGDVWMVFSHDGRLYRRALNPRMDSQYSRAALRGERDLLSLTGHHNRSLLRLQHYYDKDAVPNAIAEYEEQASEIREDIREAYEASSREAERAQRDERLLAALPQLFIAV